MFRSLTLAAASLALLSGAASAHDSYIQLRFGDWTLVNAHGAEEDDAYSLDKVLNGAAHDASGAAVGLTLDDRGAYTALLAEGASALAATYYSGFWTKDTDGEWHNEDKTQVANAEQTGEYARHAVAVIDHAEAFVPFGLPLEIIPQTDPLALEPGDSLSVQVLRDGAPLADAEIGSALPDVETVTTDADGMAEVIVREGHNILLTSASGDHPDQTRADTQTHEATLSFVPHHHHDH